MMIASSLMEKVDVSARITLTYAVMFLLFVLTVTSVGYPLSGSVEIPFMLMAVYYWSVYRPTLVPAWLVFAAGLIYDFLSGLPVGVTALSLVAVQWRVTDQRVFLMGQPYLVFWCGFVLVALLVALLQWGIYSLVQTNWSPLEPVIASIILGSILFPFVSLLLHLTHKILPVNSINFSS